MSHHKYTTESFVVSNRNYGEADATFFLLTPDLGSIWARAAGIRKEESKLRYSLELYSKALVTVVRGKEVWRITSAESIGASTHRECVSRIFFLLERLMPGEDNVTDVFEVVSELFSNLDKFGHIESSVEPLEIIMVLRILSALGYIAENKMTNKFLLVEVTLEIIIQMQEVKTEVIKIINKSLEATHL